ncbi:MAG: UTP--glucose-1-phosphate uridylyltransferase [Fastidiosipilaceae bacterium]|jgi:UTP--glucose-1-phosphate uridylyltransferase
MAKKITKAVIPAAGLGTRFLPITKGVPKEMLSIVDKPAIQYIVEEAVDSGCTDVLIIVNKGKECIENYFSPHPVYDKLTNRKLLEGLDNLLERANITFAEQKVLNGNGAAVQVAEEFANGEPFAVMFGDDVIYNPEKPVTAQLIDAYYKTNRCILGCQERPDKEATKYGVVKKGKVDGRLVEVLDLIEKPDIDKLPSNLCSLGRFILPPSIFDALRRTPLYKNEIYLTVAIEILMREEGVFAYDFEGRRYDLGDKFGFFQASVEYSLRNETIGENAKKYLEELAKKKFRT